MIPLLFACAPELLELTVERDASGVSVRASVPMERVELRDSTGALLIAQQIRPASGVTSLRTPLEPGEYEVRALSADQAALATLSVADRGPFELRIEAPLGQDELGIGEAIEVPVGSTVRVGLVVTARSELDLSWMLQGSGSRHLVPGERLVLTADLGSEPVRGRVWTDGFSVPVALDPEPISIQAVRERLSVVGLSVPAHADGTVDRTVPAGRIQLAAPWWDALLDRLQLGFRPRDDQAPRTYMAVQIANRGDRPVNTVLSGRVVLGERIHPAFRPRLRDSVDLERVRRLVRIPPGQTIAAALPIYLDRSAIPGPVEVEVEVELRTIGSSAVLHQLRVPLVVQRGTPWASAGLLAGLVGMILGWIGIAAGLKRWLGRSTGELTTIAVFGSLSFTVGAATQLVGLGLSSVLGPFAPFALGLADDALRMSLLGALLALVPRVGVFGLATLVGWLMRALALGSVHPVDALYLGNTIFLTELALWGFGVTRVEGWMEGADLVAWARLAGGLALPNAAATGLALAVSVVLYRLYYASWYVLATIAIPGLLYAAIGCAVAIPFARSLRRVG